MSRKFSARQSTIVKDLQRVMTRLNATSLKIEQDVMGEDATATVTFDRLGIRYISRCNNYEHYMDNLRASQLAIEYTWRIAESYGVDLLEDDAAGDLLERIFGTLEAPLDPNILMLGEGSEVWWEVLGVSKDASKAAIVNAFRALSKVHHLASRQPTVFFFPLEHIAFQNVPAPYLRLVPKIYLRSKHYKNQKPNLCPLKQIVMLCPLLQLSVLVESCFAKAEHNVFDC